MKLICSFVKIALLNDKLSSNQIIYNRRVQHFATLKNYFYNAIGTYPIMHNIGEKQYLLQALNLYLKAQNVRLS